jgi:FkbM family methyltransferase
MNENGTKTASRQQLVFDVGMYDASDTKYYLDLGYKVVAIEANPMLANSARQRFAGEVQNGTLTIVNAAVADGEEDVELTISGEDLGSSSTIGSRVVDRIPMGSYKVPATGFGKLVEQHGVPDYLKVDIEGADGICIRAITAATRPRFLSFEVGDDFVHLLEHLTVVGYSQFKLINQLSFREASRENLLRDRVRRKVVRMMGYTEPGCLRIKGRYFRVAHSSGPVPWESDGEWSDRAAIVEIWNKIVAAGKIGNWYDLHAK